MNIPRHDVKKVLRHGKQVLDHEVQDDGISTLGWFFKFVLVWAVIIFILSFAFNAHAQLKPATAIRAIMGEASNQGYEGMLAVACGIRNRGHLKGVYGLKAKHVDREPAYVWKIAERAWQASLNVDVVEGATHWESTDFKVPYWAKSMQKTVLIGDHQFYKAVQQ